MQPLILPANQPADRFYAGGDRIAAFRGSGRATPFTPEDWIASTTSVFDQFPAGLTTLADGTFLRDAVAGDPHGWLGPGHVQAFGADVNLLVKLLDAGERLPVHVHPDDAFAHRHLATRHGKAEAWYLLGPGVVHLGFTSAIDRRELRMLVEEQRTTELLERMHRIEVAAHDTVFVPAGLPHAIGADILLVEVQQPEDLSILLEWSGFRIDGQADGHLGLGFDLALEAVDVAARTGEDMAALVRRQPPDGPVLVPAASAFFRLDRIGPEPATLAAGFTVLIALDGQLNLRWTGGDMTVPHGSTLLVPYSAGDVTLSGATVLAARPPQASAR